MISHRLYKCKAQRSMYLSRPTTLSSLYRGSWIINWMKWMIQNKNWLKIELWMSQ